MTDPELHLIWTVRHHLVTNPAALSRFLLSVDWGCPEHRMEAYRLLQLWVSADADVLVNCLRCLYLLPPTPPPTPTPLVFCRRFPLLRSFVSLFFFPYLLPSFLSRLPLSFLFLFLFAWFFVVVCG